MSRTRAVDKPGNPHGAAPQFLIDPEALDTIAPSGDRGGVLVGASPHGKPLSASVLRPQPTRMVMVGGLYLARQIALRSLATGAWVQIATGRPAAWKMLERAAGLAPDGRPVPSMQIKKLAPFELPTATEDAPLLVIHDGGAVPQELFPPRSPWQTTLYVLPYLHPQVGNGTTANGADLVLLQRLPLNQAELAARIWHLDPATKQRQVNELTQLPDDIVIALGNNLWEPIQLGTKPAESEILGPVRRGD
ncbi:hypothetical protein GIY23_20055 [Allosaccharopolyspora coralli]|uniref:Uncharacterized protein n=1 Tax=Allosaccharopolyspora coralli TaxID=2665642 RepID=A0A5Q3QJ65_9PSEU|nr:hypothetical protein [Allosaccharopolyspora coralli]QGK71499.1 hypothetical protein GIY23_20055 [Allosaccharopolyspora coralli]